MEEKTGRIQLCMRACVSGTDQPADPQFITHHPPTYPPTYLDGQTTQWCNTLLAYCLPLPVLLRVWDVVFLDGWKALYRVCLALLQAVEENLLPLNLEDSGRCVHVPLPCLSVSLLDVSRLPPNPQLPPAVDRQAPPSLERAEPPPACRPGLQDHARGAAGADRRVLPDAAEVRKEEREGFIRRVLIGPARPLSFSRFVN